MNLTFDRALKVLWMAIGVILLGFLLFAAVFLIGDLIGNLGAGDEAVRVAQEERPAREEALAVRYSHPVAVRGTATRLVFIDYGQGSGGSGYSPSSRYPGAAQHVNVAFVSGGGARLLVNRPALIREVDYPGVAGPSPEPQAADTVARGWITYQIALDDTNGNRRLDERDRFALYVSDLEGRNLRPVLEPRLRYRSHSTLSPTQLLVYALEPRQGQEVSEDRIPQRAYVYDVPSARLTVHAGLDSVTVRAGQVLAQ